MHRRSNAGGIAPRVARQRLRTLSRSAAWPLSRLDALIIACWFVASRAWLAAIGVAPDPTALERLWQLLPIESLQSDLLGSLWLLHSQPPLFNLVVGVALHLPGEAALWLRAMWWLTGLALPLVVFSTLRVVSMPRGLAHALVLLFSFNPTLALYENFFLYTYLEACLVLVAMFALVRHPSSPWLYGMASSALVAMRALFQPVWALAVAAALIKGIGRTRAQSISMWLLVPVIVGVALMAKNGVLWGVWSTSSWYGLNIARLPYAALAADAPELSAAGVVSPTFVVGPFHNVGDYPIELVRDTMVHTRERYGIRADLTHVLKASGSENFNNVGQIPISRQLARDAVAATIARPGPVAALAVEGFGRFLDPASEVLFLDANRARLATLERAYRSVLYPGASRVLVAAWLLLALATSAWLWMRAPEDAERLRGAAAFVCLTTVWVTLVANLTEFGENNRFRFTLDPMLFAWNVAVLWWFYARIISSRIHG